MNLARDSPFSAAALYHEKARASSRPTTSPARYSSARAICASEFPSSAAAVRCSM